MNNEYFNINNPIYIYNTNTPSIINNMNNINSSIGNLVSDTFISQNSTITNLFNTVSSIQFQIKNRLLSTLAPVVVKAIPREQWQGLMVVPF
jgi:phage-related protein